MNPIISNNKKGMMKESSASAEMLSSLNAALLTCTLENVGSALAMYDSGWNLKYCNNGLESIIGYSFKELSKELLKSILGAKKFNMLFDTNMLKPGMSFKLSGIEVIHKNGVKHIVTIHIVSVVVGLNKHMLVIVSDKTEEVEQQKRLNRLSSMKDVILDINHKMSSGIQKEAFFEYLLNRVKEFMPYADLGTILVFDEEDKDTLVCVASYGYSEENISTFRLKLKESFIYKEAGGQFEQTLIVNNIQKLMEGDYPVLVRNDQHLDIQSTICGPIIKENRLYGFINIDSSKNNIYNEDDVDIMEYLRTQVGTVLSQWDIIRRNAYLSKHDALTGFFNRWYLDQIDEDQYKRWKRQKCNVVCTVMDLNGLKSVNDQAGHHIGDAYIAVFCETIKSIFRSRDYFFRLGGDEFAGVFFDIDEAKLFKKMMKVNAILRTSDIQTHACELSLGFAFGIAHIDESQKGIYEMLRIADARMYRHKTEMKKRQR